MHLKRLELSGFKSFPKATFLDFPAKITAIVGPNGSGKSNITEAIRWVLGEQSIKTLRGKKGEDLIWNGSSVSAPGGPQVPRMGKASVFLRFDNKDGKIPLDFEEVSLGRKIFRDGLNEYYLNDSQVRLKDVVELLAQMGLGETKHNIIGQGEVDRMLVARPQDRREMLEEALGLRVYQLKKNESERKLSATESNMKQVEALIRELAPHLKFLRSQAQKAQTRGDLEIELCGLLAVYFAKEQNEIAQERARIETELKPLGEKKKILQKLVAELREEIAKFEKKVSSEESEEPKELETLRKLETRREELGRELGRLEGKLEAERKQSEMQNGTEQNLGVGKETYDELVQSIRAFLADAKSMLEEEDQLEILRSHLLALIEGLEHTLKELERGNRSKTAEAVPAPELEKETRHLEKELEDLGKKIEALRSTDAKERAEFLRIQREIRERDAKFRGVQDELHALDLHIERFRFDEERISERERAWRAELHETGVAAADLSDPETKNTHFEKHELRRRIDRIRAKLEEAGGIDASVLNEFQELEGRHTFLSKELEDLRQAVKSLKELIRELEHHIRQDFQEGFQKVKHEFNEFFRIIFGGGKATLGIVKIESRSKEEEGLPSEALAEEGIEIEVDLPRKRIKGLDMLSGGERSLTSIALLFALTAIHPPPFLILDETDAALDEANSQRYAGILRELAKRTQLILVTHNRETMKCAGLLYGVTMGEDGVSKLISLKLEEAVDIIGSAR